MMLGVKADGTASYFGVVSVREVCNHSLSCTRVSGNAMDTSFHDCDFFDGHLSGSN